MVAAKSYFGNLGAASGLVELIASLSAFEHGRLFPVLNYETPDPACRLNVVTAADVPPGETVLNVSFTPQGQASAVIWCGRSRASGAATGTAQSLVLADGSAVRRSNCPDCLLLGPLRVLPAEL